MDRALSCSAASQIAQELEVLAKKPGMGDPEEVSDPRDARGGAPRPPAAPQSPKAPARPPVAGQVGSPRPPGTAPRAPAASSPALPPPVPAPSNPARPRAPSTPDDLWDDAEELRPSSIIPLDGTPTPRAAETAPLPVDPPSIPELTEPVRIVPVPQESASLTADAEEQLFAVLRASLEASLLPLVEKQRELEARVEALRTAGAAKSPAAVRATSPTMPLGPSASVKPIVTTYGLVTPSIAPKPALDLENVGPIEVPNFGKSRVGTVLVVLLVVGVVGAIIAAVASHG